MKRRITWVTLAIECGYHDQRKRIRLLQPIEVKTWIDKDGIWSASALGGEFKTGLRERIDLAISAGEKINPCDYQNTEKEAIGSIRYSIGSELTSGVCMYARHDYTKKGMASHEHFRKLITPYICDGWFEEWEQIGRHERHERRFPVLNMKKRKQSGVESNPQQGE